MLIFDLKLSPCGSFAESFRFRVRDSGDTSNFEGWAKVSSCSEREVAQRLGLGVVWGPSSEGSRLRFEARGWVRVVAWGSRFFLQFAGRRYQRSHVASSMLSGHQRLQLAD